MLGKRASRPCGRNQNVHFKLEYTVRKLWLPPDGNISFNFGALHNRKVELRCPSEQQEQSQGHPFRPVEALHQVAADFGLLQQHGDRLSRVDDGRALAAALGVVRERLVQLIGQSELS